MSKVAIKGNASGTGTFTLEAPNSNTDRTLTLPDEAGTVLTSGGAIDVNASAPADSVAIDASGNVLVGQTTSSFATKGIRLRGDVGQVTATRDGGAPVGLNRLTSNGSLLDFSKDGTTIGSIGVDNRLWIADTTGGIRFASIGSGQMALHPVDSSGASVDNTHDLGLSSVRWDDIYATNGTIQTSDRNEKQDIASLTTAEMAVAARLANQFKTFRWIDSVTEKGDNARTHAGIIAQDVQQAFTDEGLDASDYALFISNTWWEADEDYTDDDGVAQTRTNTYETANEAPEGATERTRMGIRYPELLSFMQAYNDQRMTSIEARLDALEATP